uniref:Uncharacterized protein n=1 Tax=Arundo donax TaxID=35708 RepID=A0A0A8Z0L7_ARUDO
MCIRFNWDFGTNGSLGHIEFDTFRIEDIPHFPLYQDDGNTRFKFVTEPDNREEKARERSTTILTLP